MRRSTIEPSGARARRDGPYDQLRRANRDGELRHHDHAGLRVLMQDYFALADELELDGVGPKRAA